MEENNANEFNQSTVKKSVPFNLIGAVLFSLIALQRLTAIIPLFKHGFSVGRIYPVLLIAGALIMAISLFIGRKDELTIIGFGILALSALSYFIFSLTGPFLYVLANLINLAGYLAAFGLALVSITDIGAKYKEKAIQLWYLPSACIAGQIIVRIMLRIVSRYRVGFIGHIACAAAVLFALISLIEPDLGFIKNTKPAGGTEHTSNTSYTPYIYEPDGYCSMGKHIVLLLFTCGIWYYIWIYRITGYLNRVEDEPPREPVTKLLLCIFVPFYSIYWTYKSAQRIDRLAAANGIQSDLSTVCLVLAIFIGIIPPIIMQDKLNSIIMSEKSAPAYSQTYTAAQTVQTAQTTQTVADIPEELKKYKSLLDDGVITQEEFDKKKKQLLDI